jgi:formamidopyrimidine-DNA glycosylase
LEGKVPELPDVEIFRQYLNRTALHKTIDEVVVKQERVLSGISPGELESELKGKQIESSFRRGKLLLASLKGGGFLGLHFGMSGQLKYFKNSPENPEYSCVLFGFKNHFRLAYESRRKLGRIYLVDDADAFIEKKGLGPDALDCDFGTFEEAVSSQKKAVKAALMDQHRLAGIGNIYSDEILFQARMSPTIAVNRLGRKARNKLFRAVKKVLQTAIDRKANPDHLPSSYLTPHRHKEGKCPKCGSRLKKAAMSGRGYYYCPKDQK